MRIFSKKRKKAYRLVQIFSLFALVFNMSLSGVFFIVLPTVQAGELPHIDVAKQAESSVCEEAEITLTITGAGDPIDQRKPVDVVFVIDRSASMADTYLANVKTAVSDFIGEMYFNGSDPDRVAIVSYAGYGSDLSQINYPFGSDEIAAIVALNSITALGGTCIECGLATAYGMLGGSSHEQFVILLSDGVANVDSSNQVCVGTICPESNTPCISNAIAEGSNIKGMGVPVYSIGYRLGDISGTGPGQCDNGGATEALAEQTLKDISSDPVDYYYSGDPSNINSVFDEISNEINDIAGYDAKIVEILPTGLTYNGMASGYPNPDSTQSVASGTELVWNFGNISIGESKEVIFSVTSGSSGYTGLADVYPDTKVDYKDYEDNLQSTAFPETHVAIDSCIPPETASSSLTIYKYSYDAIQMATNTDESFAFTAFDYLGETVFSENFSLKGGSSITFYGLSSSTYEIFESFSSDQNNAGWFSGQYVDGVSWGPGIECSVPLTGNGGNGVRVEIGEEENISCTFYNLIDDCAPTTGSISGYKYEDADNDASTTADWTGLGDWIISLFDNSGSADPIATTTTNSSGYFSFSSLVDGIYNLTETMKSSLWTQLLAPSTITIDGANDSIDNNFVNYEESNDPERSVISGCKYNDTGHDGSHVDDSTMSGWEIQLIGCGSYTPLSPSESILLPLSQIEDLDSGEPGACRTIATTTTVNGCYSFTVLEEGNYGIAEVQQDGWSQTLPADDSFYYFNLPLGTSITDMHFANNSEKGYYWYAEWSDCSETCGGGTKSKIIECHDESEVTVSDSYCDEKTRPDEESQDCNTQSCGGGGLLIPTNRFGGTSSNQPIVKGEEGMPNLVITKEVSPNQVNRGDKAIEYVVNVSNNGTLSAFTVTLTDVLPSGLSYSDYAEQGHTWDLGDIAPGETKSTSFNVDVDSDAPLGNLTNVATAVAENHDEISADTTIEVLEVVVLAESGFSWFEFLATAYGALALFVIGRSLKSETV